MRACPECLSVFVADPEYCSFDGTALKAHDALFGKVIAGNRIEALLGIGGTGCVFRGVRVADHTPCAVKVLFGEMATDKSISTRFEREAEAMSAIAHRNVVQIFDYGTTDRNMIYLVMAFLDGVTLKERIERDAPLTHDHAGRIVEQLTAGLAEAHRQGFVHRDLKPGNVILVGPFGREEVKILDFGIVASLRENNDRERLTKTGYIIGTPTYMAPEQVDPTAITPQVDVYALGVILYEMLTGFPPFTGTLEQILVAKMTTAAKPIVNGGELGELALAMLDMNPDRRPASALHVSAQLSRLSLLTDDPKTVRTDVPELETWSVHAPASSADVLIIDRTDENEVEEETHEDAEAALQDAWVAKTRPVELPADDPYHLEFGDISTRNETEKRSDTLVDGVAIDAFDQLPGMSTPTSPGDVSEVDTGEEDVSEEVPTRITERPEFNMRDGRDPIEGNSRTTGNEAVTAIDLLDADTNDQGSSIPQIDEAGDADTALDMRIDHLFPTSTPTIEPIPPEPAEVSPTTVPVDRADPPRRNQTLLVLGIAVAVALGIAAAATIVTIATSTNETVIVDVPP